MNNWIKNYKNTTRIICISLLMGASCWANAQETKLDVRHLASEQNIVSIREAKKYLLMPVEDQAPESRVYVIKGNDRIGTVKNIRLARQHVDYYVPLDLSDFAGEAVSLDIQGLPESAVCWKHLKPSETFDLKNREKFRPLYHHTPAYGWMNDPNGMFYQDGTYHLYFQHNPYGSTWGNLAWGHSTSTDLVHWTYEGDAVMPDAWGMIFSGSSVVDKENRAGFGEGAVIAFYTSAKPSPWGDCQTQSLAYSLDKGKTFIKYEKNPILVSEERDFRDPKVFWYAPGKHWVMLLAVGQEMQIFSSKNLKEWKKESSFGAKQGAHGGVWECPDLVELPVEGTKEKKWVLICNINPGGPFGGSATQYFVGTFDGKKFTNESPTQTKWMDWGKDNYATVTWNNAPDDRCIALGWMSNWQYQTLLPTSQYRGANTIARDLTLYLADGDYFLQSAPSPEIEQARGEKKSFPKFKVRDTYEIESLLPENKGAYEMVISIQNAGASKIELTLSNTKGEKIYMYYNVPRKQFVMDRSESGLVNFSQDFPAVTVAPIHDTDDIQLRLFLDRSSIEAFGEGGKYVMTNRVFPSEAYNRLSFTSSRGSFTVKSLDIYPLK